MIIIPRQKGRIWAHAVGQTNLKALSYAVQISACTDDDSGALNQLWCLVFGVQLRERMMKHPPVDVSCIPCHIVFCCYAVIHLASVNTSRMNWQAC